ALDALEREQWKAACMRFDRPTLLQQIVVRSGDGETVTRKSPSNAALLHETGRAVHPPEQVCRSFDFVDGVPPEYSSFTGSEELHTFEQIVPVSIRRATVAEEQNLATP